ncbi:MAG TPA: hypothetical protein VG269_15970 [Tepidisphaeraceae bacterium]|jgi:hypothetical protein|nr:hypothetical protein [Tepidisphaeraceae bacterium]
MNIHLHLDVQCVNGTAKGIVTARTVEGITIHTDTGNWLSAATRKRFCEAVADKADSPDSACEVERLLLAQLDELRQQPPNAANSATFDVSNVVRPDLFIRPEVIGLSIPQPFLADDRIDAKWVLYTRGADGTREARDLPDSLDMPDGTKLWIDPRPCAPTPSTAPGWTPAARRRWLEGADDPDPVAVFGRLCRAIDHFIDFPAEQAQGMTATLALWIMLSYIYPAWDAVPYLYLGGPLGSGKSRVLDVLIRTVLRPVPSSNTTAPCLFRTLHDRGGVLLLDEAERLKDGTPDAGEIRSILLAGYKRGGKATRLEKVGDGFKPVEFDCYGPKAVACITGVPAPVASRCIQFIMFRAASGSEKPKRRIEADPQLWTDLRDDLHALALGPMGLAAPGLSRRSDVCALSNRNHELWQPITALAAWLEDAGATGLLALLQGFASSSAESSADDSTPDADETLLRIMAEEVTAGNTPTPGEVLAKAKLSESETFQRWQAAAVSRHLRLYGLQARKSNGVRFFDVTLDDLRRVQRNYGIDLGIGGEGG